jgi:hypothetical protein
MWRLEASSSARRTRIGRASALDTRARDVVVLLLGGCRGRNGIFIAADQLRF